MLKIHTVTKDFIYHEKEDQAKLLDAINAAHTMGAPFTVPVMLHDGKVISFVIRNVIAYEIQ